MELTKIHEIIAWIVASQSLLLSLFVFTNTHKKQLSGYLFAGFLLLVTFIYCNCLTGFSYSFLYANFPHLIYVFSPFWYLLAPFLYLLVRSLIVPEFRLKGVHSIHLVPFLVDVSFLVASYHIHDADTKRRILDSGVLFRPELIINGISHILIVLYLFFAFLNIRKHQLQRKRNLQEITSKVPVKWLYFIVLGYFGVWLFWGINFTVFIFTGRSYELLSMIAKVTILSYSAAMVWNGLKDPHLLTSPGNGSRWKKLAHTKMEIRRHFNHVLDYMKNERPYLNPELTIVSLAEQLNMSERHLSLLINSSSYGNFNEFVNSYRIEDARQLMIQNKDITILEILYEVGFNSKSAFYAAFKKAIGVTPTHYREQYADSSVLSEIVFH